jgi:hypothetical protein
MKERPQKVHWSVLLWAGVLAVANAAALCFGLFMLFIDYSEMQYSHERWGLVGIVMLFPYALLVMSLLLVATVVFAIQAKQMPRTFRVALLVPIAVGVVAELIAFGWALAI